jgi:hypothetical protein
MSQFGFQKPAGLMVFVALVFVVALLILSGFRRSAPAVGAMPGTVAPKERSEQRREPKQLTGEAAQKYLQQPGEGQSLMHAITVARFGLKSQERGPFGETGGGYLGMSHEQNLNAWFADDGVTVRPTVSEQERERSWHMELRLKAYGYGNDLIPAPPIVSQHVKDNRIEYERRDCRLSIANCRPAKAAVTSLQSPGNQLFQSAIGNPRSAIIEWYQNRAEGIEQGFTIYEQPDHNGALQSEALRLVIDLSGELQAHAKNGGQTIELADSRSKPTLSYSQLTAVDAKGNQLPAHMETRANGGEITLIVDDRNASYPISIDPIIATVEKILDLPLTQTGAQFGDAVAISGNWAIVGFWLYDESPTKVDSGRVSIFERVGSTWNETAGLAGGGSAHGECGYSVAISSTRAAYGCPGANVNTGRAFQFGLDPNILDFTELFPASKTAGEFFGASVTTDGNKIVVGSPLASFDSTHSHSGAISLFQDNIFVQRLEATATNELMGTSLSLQGDTLLVGATGALSNTGEAFVISTFGGELNFDRALIASDGAPGDVFGTAVAISNNTAIIAASGDDDRGTDAGAAYVFVRNVASGQWNQQQKLTANDGKANDIFSYFSVAIEGNTIVVGARRNDGVSSNPNDNRGAAYVFTRSGTVWTQQTKLGATPFLGAPGDEFGTSVGISGNTVISSAPHSAANDGTPNVGVSYIFRLDCVPPIYSLILNRLDGYPVSTLAICPGSSAQLEVYSQASTAQKWGQHPGRNCRRSTN